MKKNSIFQQNAEALMNVSTEKILQIIRTQNLSTEHKMIIAKRGNRQEIYELLRMIPPYTLTCIIKSDRHDEVMFLCRYYADGMSAMQQEMILLRRNHQEIMTLLQNCTEIPPSLKRMIDGKTYDLILNKEEIALVHEKWPIEAHKMS